MLFLQLICAYDANEIVSGKEANAVKRQWSLDISPLKNHHLGNIPPETIVTRHKPPEKNSTWEKISLETIVPK